MTATDNCVSCGRPIKVMAFMGTGICSDDCRKIKEAKSPARAVRRRPRDPGRKVKRAG